MKRFLLVLTLLCTMLTSVFADWNGKFDWGEWSFNSSTGTLTVVTHGKDMPDFSVESPAPWVAMEARHLELINEGYSGFKLIRKIVTDAPVIGANAFRDLTFVRTIEADKAKIVHNAAFYNCGVEGVTIYMPNLEIAGDWAFTHSNAAVIVLPKIQVIGWECFTYSPFLMQVDLGPDLTEIKGWAFGYCPMMWLDDEPNIFLHCKNAPTFGRGKWHPGKNVIFNRGKQPDPSAIPYGNAATFAICYDREDLMDVELYPYISTLESSTAEKDCSLFHPAADGEYFTGKPVIVISEEGWEEARSSWNSLIAGWKDEAKFYIGGRIKTQEEVYRPEMCDYTGYWHRGEPGSLEDLTICSYILHIHEYVKEDEITDKIITMSGYPGFYDPAGNMYTQHVSNPDGSIQKVRENLLATGMPWAKCLVNTGSVKRVHVKAANIIPFMFGPMLNCLEDFTMEGVQEIGAFAFSCSGMSNSLDLSKITKIGRGAFMYSNAQTEANMPNLEELGTIAFWRSAALTKALLGNRLEMTEVPNGAFNQCEKLEEVYLGQYITSIEESVFSNSGLANGNPAKGLFLSGDAPSVTKSAFSNLKLSDIYVHVPSDSYSTYIKDGSLWNDMNVLSDIAFPIEGKGWRLTADGQLTISADIPDKTSASGYPWSQYKRYIKAVVVEDGVTYIGDYAFYMSKDASQITTVALGKDVKRIGKWAFRGCNELKYIYSMDYKKADIRRTFYDEAYKASARKANMYLYQVEEIGEEAFRDCDLMETVYLGEKLTKMGDYVFRNCPLKEVYVYTKTPATITKNTFSFTTANVIRAYIRHESRSTELNYIMADYWKELRFTMSGLVVWHSSTVGNGNFVLTSDSTLHMWLADESNTEVLNQGSSFADNGPTWSSVKLNETGQAKHGTSARVADIVKRVEVTGKVTLIGPAFCELPHLTDVKFPASVRQINGTFFGCKGLKRVSLSHVVEIGDPKKLNEDNFRLDYLRSYDAEDHLYSGTFAYCTALEVVSMPSVRVISTNSFKGCTALKNYAFNHLDSIGSEAFYGCSAIEVFDARNTKLAMRAFEHCTGLKGAIIGHASEYTGVQAFLFKDCENLEWVQMDDEIVNFGLSAFNGCKNLKTIYCYTPNPPTIDYVDVFEGCDLSQITVYTYADYVDKYKKADKWKEMKQITVEDQYMSYAALPAGGYLGNGNYTSGAKWEISTAGEVTVQADGKLPDVGTYSKARYFSDYVTEVRVNKGITEIEGQVVPCTRKPDNLTRIYLPSTLEKISGEYVFGNSLRPNEDLEVYCYAVNPPEMWLKETSLGTIRYKKTPFGALYLYSEEEEDYETKNATELARRITKLHVPHGSKAAYEAATGYEYAFKEIVDDLTEDGEQYIPKQHSVTFLGWNDEWITTQLVNEGEDAVKPEEDPEHLGYQFDGWDTDFTNVTEDLVVRAKFINGYLVTGLQWWADQVNPQIIHFSWDALPEAASYGVMGRLMDIESNSLPLQNNPDTINGKTTETHFSHDFSHLEVGEYKIWCQVIALNEKDELLTNVWLAIFGAGGVEVPLTITVHSDPQHIGEIQTPDTDTRKLLRNGQILIQRGNRTYTLTGQEIK